MSDDGFRCAHPSYDRSWNRSSSDIAFSPLGIRNRQLDRADQAVRAEFATDRRIWDAFFDQAGSEAFGRRLCRSRDAVLTPDNRQKGPIVPNVRGPAQVDAAGLPRERAVLGGI